MTDKGYQVHGSIEMVKPDASFNWTGMELLPFEIIAERFLDLEHDGHTTTVTVSFGKPFVVNERGWACPFRITSPGAEHIVPAEGSDSVHAIQMAMHLANNELAAMATDHALSFQGSKNLGFDAATPTPTKQT